jgi:Cu+-exporting ATPase
MDALVALGTNATYFYSVYVVIKTLTLATFQGQYFFETSSMLISFILLGKYLEIMTKGKTSFGKLLIFCSCVCVFHDSSHASYIW